MTGTPEQYKRHRKRRPWIALLSAARRRAIKFDREYSLTLEWAEQSYTGYCSLTGIPFVISFGRNGGGPYSPSLDRIDSSKGYTPDNCRWILSSLNKFFGDMDDQTALRIARAFVDQYTDD